MKFVGNRFRHDPASGYSFIMVGHGRSLHQDFGGSSENRDRSSYDLLSYGMIPSNSNYSKIWRRKKLFKIFIIFAPDEFSKYFWSKNYQIFFRSRSFSGRFILFECILTVYFVIIRVLTSLETRSIDLASANSSLKVRAKRESMQWRWSSICLCVGNSQLMSANCWSSHWYVLSLKRKFINFISTAYFSLLLTSHRFSKDSRGSINEIVFFLFVQKVSRKFL